MTEEDITLLIALVESHMQTRYRRGLADMVITDTPGYWQDKEARMHPGHPLHGCIGHEGPFKATYNYFDAPRVKGRFSSPTRTWAAIKRYQEQEATK